MRASFGVLGVGTGVDERNWGPWSRKRATPLSVPGFSCVTIQATYLFKDLSSMESRQASSELFCSFCYGSVEKLLYCGKCRKRGYCSAECQREDWKSASHKFWCGKNVGEMLTDVEVRPIEGKGLGMVALRPFAKSDMILVERPILLLRESGMRPPSINQVSGAMALTPNDPGASLAKVHEQQHGVLG